MNLPLKLIKINIHDALLLWEWVNDPAVRGSAFDGNMISWEAHLEWLKTKLRDSRCFHYKALDEQNRAFGQIRFDLSDGRADIDISIDREFRGYGLGAALLLSGIRTLCQELEQPLQFQGRIKDTNQASVHTFKNAGFRFIASKKTSDHRRKTIGYSIYQLEKNPN